MAGIEIAADRPLAALEPFRSHSNLPAILIGDLPGRRFPEPPREEVEIREAQGFLAGGERTVRATWRGEAQVDFECEGSAVSWRQGPPDGPQRLSPADDSAVTRELLLGPGLLLSLFAARRVTLHASAVQLGGRVLALVGESGRGKSTLAAAFGDQALADDLVSVDMTTLALAARFPQRKWPEAKQARLPERAGIVTLVELQGNPQLGWAHLEKLSAASAARCWISHAVPARLFSSAWNRRLLALAADAAQATEAFRLHLPWRPSEAEAITADTVALLRRTFGAGSPA